MDTKIIGFGKGLGRSAVLAGFFTSLVYAEPTMALRNVKPGDAIPAFSVKCLDGRSLTTSDLKDKTALLLFVRPDHPASLTALKEANRVRRDYRDAALVILAVSTDEDGGGYFTRMVADHQLGLPIALDRGREMYGTYGVVVAPTTLLIDATGILRFELPHLPPNYTDRLRGHLDLLLGRITVEEHEAGSTLTKPTVPASQRRAERKLAMAESLMAQNDFSQAMAVLAELNTEGADPHIALLLGICNVKVGHLTDAAELLESASVKEAKPQGLTLALAQLAVARKQDDRAEVLLLKAVEDANDPVPALYELGQLYERNKDFEQAIACYRKALEHLLKKQ